MAFPTGPLEPYEQKERDWIIPRLLSRRNTGFMCGVPKKAHKSWLLLNLAWDLGIWPWSKTNHRAKEYIHPHPIARPMRVVYFGWAVAAA